MPVRGSIQTVKPSPPAAEGSDHPQEEWAMRSTRRAAVTRSRTEGAQPPMPVRDTDKIKRVLKPTRNQDVSAHVRRHLPLAVC
jgi:hypothetical protein